MTKNPYINAVSALAYIVLLVVAMNLAIRFLAPGPDTEETSYIMPIIMLSLFTLSAAVMGYLFLLQPLLLYLDGNKKEGVKLFVQTLATFAALTIIIILALLGWNSWK